MYLLNDISKIRDYELENKWEGNVRNWSKNKERENLVNSVPGEVVKTKFKILKGDIKYKT